MAKKVIIVGGVAGGASTAARLRRMNEFAEIVILERGDYVSFANCGLPYYVGHVIKQQSKLLLMTPELFLDRFNIDVRVKNEAISIDREKKMIIVYDSRKNNEYNLDYDILVLSPGAEPIKPPFKGMEDIPLFTLRNVPDSVKIDNYIKKNKPETAVVVGGGFIGIEMAENLAERDIFVTIVEMMDQVLPNLDYEMAQFVHQELFMNGVDLVLGDGVKSFSKDENGKYYVHTQNGKQLETDMVILAIGVKPETKLAKDAGLELGPRGHIVVNKNMKTSDPTIYAVGDAIQLTDFITKENTAIPLAGPANKQGRIAADNIAGKITEFNGVMGTAVVKVFGLIVAQVGLNEKRAEKSGFNYEKVYLFPNNHAGYYPDAEKLSMKLIFEKPSGKILGIQVVGGKGSEKRVDVISTVIYFGGNVFDLEKLELAYAPPFGSAKDPVNMAGFIASNILRGDMKIWHWNQFDAVNEKNGAIIDVRTKFEYDIGNIEGSINISDLNLRNQLERVPKNKPIYLYCQVGFRAYLAYRNLVQRGYNNVYNLSGGYKLYEIANLSLEDLKKLSGDPKSVFIEKQKDKISDKSKEIGKIIEVDACGVSCPGPLNALIRSVKKAPVNSIIRISASDPGFNSSVNAWTTLTEGVDLISLKKEDGKIIATVRKNTDDLRITIDEEEEQEFEEEEEPEPITEKKSKRRGRIKPAGESPYTTIQPEELHERLGKPDAPAILIDVRPPREIMTSGGKIPGSMVIPLNDLMNSLYLIDEYKDEEIVTVCRSGSRSMMAAQLLARAGFKDIRSLSGGAMLWMAKRFQLEKTI